MNNKPYLHLFKKTSNGKYSVEAKFRIGIIGFEGMNINPSTLIAPRTNYPSSNWDYLEVYAGETNYDNPFDGLLLSDFERGENKAGIIVQIIDNSLSTNKVKGQSVVHYDDADSEGSSGGGGVS